MKILLKSISLKDVLPSRNHLKVAIVGIHSVSREISDCADGIPSIKVPHCLRCFIINFLDCDCFLAHLSVERRSSIQRSSIDNSLKVIILDILHSRKGG